jgi:hypothetical protein
MIVPSRDSTGAALLGIGILAGINDLANELTRPPRFRA